jgi:hypothetical protein
MYLPLCAAQPVLRQLQLCACFRLIVWVVVLYGDFLKNCGRLGSSRPQLADMEELGLVEFLMGHVRQHASAGEWALVCCTCACSV